MIDDRCDACYRCTDCDRMVCRDERPSPGENGPEPKCDDCVGGAEVPC